MTFKMPFFADEDNDDEAISLINDAFDELSSEEGGEEEEDEENGKDYHGSHNQKSHGRRGSALAGKLLGGGGFTYNPIKLEHEAPASGFSVGIDKSTELVLDGTLPRKQLKKRIMDYIQKHRSSLHEEKRYAGGWYNPDDKKVYLDIPKVLTSRREAMVEGLKAKQLAIYDLGKGKTIDLSPFKLQHGRLIRGRA